MPPVSPDPRPQVVAMTAGISDSAFSDAAASRHTSEDLDDSARSGLRHADTERGTSLERASSIKRCLWKSAISQVRYLRSHSQTGVVQSAICYLGVHAYNSKPSGLISLCSYRMSASRSQHQFEGLTSCGVYAPRAGIDVLVRC